MQLPDVNVLIYAHREDAPEHDRYVTWLRALTDSDEPFALSDAVLARFLRIVTTLGSSILRRRWIGPLHFASVWWTGLVRR